MAKIGDYRGERRQAKSDMQIKPEEVAALKMFLYIVFLKLLFIPSPVSINS